MPRLMLPLLILSSVPLLAAPSEPVEKREVIVKLAGADDHAEPLTLDLSDLAIGESRELTTETGRVVIVQRDEAGYLLDLGDGKTLRVDDIHDMAFAFHNDDEGQVRIEKRVVREGDGSNDVRVFVFHGEDGEVVDLEGVDHDFEWHGEAGAHHVIELDEAADGSHPRVLMLRGDGAEDGAHRVEVRTHVVGGEGEGEPQVVIRRLGDGEELDDAELEAMIADLRAEHPCPEGDADCRTKVIVIEKRVEREESPED